MDSEPRGEQPPELRASDADREHAVERLRRHHADGRLDLDEFEQRMGQAYSAKTVAELDLLMRDLPPDVTPVPAPVTGPPLSPRPSRARLRQGFSRSLASYLAVMGLLVVIWAVTGAGYFWPIWPMIGWGFAIVWQGINTFVGGDNERGQRRGR